MIPTETVPGIREGGIIESDGGGEFSMIHLMHCKNFSKCHNVPSPSTTIKKKKKKEKQDPILQRELKGKLLLQWGENLFGLFQRQHRMKE
jgi:hypothetical protein